MKNSISILGCGWLGEPLAVHLIGKGCSVKGSTTSENKLQKLYELNIEPYLLKLNSISSGISEFLSSEILIIAIPSKDIEGFKVLRNYIEKSTIKYVLFVSSTSVYANSNELITEENPVLSSALAEIENVFITNTSFKTTIIRFGGLLGYNRKPGLFYPKGRVIENPDSAVNMIHRVDCIGIINAIIEKEIWNEIFNGCADSHPTKREFYTKAALDIGLQIPLFDESKSGENKIISSQKLKVELNYKFKYPDLLNIAE
ncbi:MAG: SDR family NAD(P)-dependent oxidoreductase [Bacteroidia bacterium]|nr:SDR family NAD(P)-dependent oxidoreductase [Bacteroidia bacterium]